MVLDRDARWRIKTIVLSLGVIAVAAGMVFAMETWRSVFEPLVQVVEALATKGHGRYDPSHYRLWEAVLAVSLMGVSGLGVWSAFGDNPDRLLDAHLQAKLDIQARAHTRGLDN